MKRITTALAVATTACLAAPAVVVGDAQWRRDIAPRQSAAPGYEPTSQGCMSINGTWYSFAFDEGIVRYYNDAGDYRARWYGGKFTNMSDTVIVVCEASP
jgi:hypothetical protein